MNDIISINVDWRWYIKIFTPSKQLLVKMLSIIATTSLLGFLLMQYFNIGSGCCIGKGDAYEYVPLRYLMPAIDYSVKEPTEMTVTIKQ